MNGDASKQRYVSTFRMHIKSPRASPEPENGPGTVDTTCTDTGKGCMKKGREEINNLKGVCLSWRELQW